MYICTGFFFSVRMDEIYIIKSDMSTGDVTRVGGNARERSRMQSWPVMEAICVSLGRAEKEDFTYLITLALIK
jgi:hypothetical protein